MNFSPLPTKVYTYEEVCARLLAYNLCPGAVKESIQHVQKVDPPKELSIHAAFKLFHHMGSAALKSESHPVKRLEKVLSVAEVAIKIDSITAVVEGEAKVFSLSRGYAVENPTGPEPLMAHAADAMAYCYTQASPSTSVSLESNFAKTVAKAALPRITKAMPLSTEWLVSNALQNAYNTYDAMSKDRGSTFEAHHQLVEMLDEAVKATPGRVVSNYIPAPAVCPAPLQQTISSKQMVQVARPFVPGLQTITDLSSAWKYLSIHRTFRGEDQRWISPMTAGYYYCSMTRSIDRLFWNVVDILYVLKLYELNVVYFVKKPSMSICQSLVRNDVVVILTTVMATTNPIALSEDGVPCPGIYTVSSLHDVDLNYLTVRCPEPGTRPIVKTTGPEYPLEEDYRQAVNQWSRDDRPWMAHCYMTPSIMRDCQDHIIPSIHAHAGHMIIHGPKRHQPLTKEDLIKRFAAANVYKTWFPLTRVRFLEHDYFNLKFQNHVLNHFVLSVSMLKTTNATFDYGRYDILLPPALKKILEIQPVKWGVLWGEKATEYQPVVPVTLPTQVVPRENRQARLYELIPSDQVSVIQEEPDDVDFGEEGEIF